MRNAIAVLFLVSLSCVASPVTYVGFEDWSGPSSDRDFNDLVITVTGVNFVQLGEWTRPDPPPYPGEIQYPFPTAYYFRDAYVGTWGEEDISFVSSGTAGDDKLYVDVGLSGWTLLTGVLTFHVPNVGSLVGFKLVQGSTVLYPGFDENADGLYHAVEYSPSPEPTPLGLLGLGLALIIARVAAGGLLLTWGAAIHRIMKRG